MGCAALAVVALTVAGLQGFHTPGTLGCTVLGVAGAVYCSVRGLQDLMNLEWYKRRLAQRPDRDE
jgi:hypothetical protein